MTIRAWTTAVVGCLLGAAVALLAASATWVHTDVRDAATVGSGASAAPLAVKLGAERPRARVGAAARPGVVDELQLGGGDAEERDAHRRSWR